MSPWSNWYLLLLKLNVFLFVSWWLLDKTSFWAFLTSWMWVQKKRDRHSLAVEFFVQFIFLTQWHLLFNHNFELFPNLQQLAITFSHTSSTSKEPLFHLSKSDKKPDFSSISEEKTCLFWLPIFELNFGLVVKSGLLDNSSTSLNVSTAKEVTAFPWLWSCLPNLFSTHDGSRFSTTIWI